MTTKRQIEWHFPYSDKVLGVGERERERERRALFWERQVR